MAGEKIIPMAAPGSPDDGGWHSGLVFVTQNLKEAVAQGDLVEIAHHYGFALQAGDKNDTIHICVECNLVQWPVDATTGYWSKPRTPGTEVVADENGVLRDLKPGQNPRAADRKLGIIERKYDPATAVEGKATAYLVWRSDR